MVVLHWLLAQIIETYRQVRIDVTIPHVFTGIVLYTIVHTASKTGHQSAMRTKKLLVAEIKRYGHLRAPNGHPKHCVCVECVDYSGSPENADTLVAVAAGALVTTDEVSAGTSSADSTML